MPVVRIKNLTTQLVSLGAGFGQVPPLVTRSVELTTAQIEHLRPSLQDLARAGSIAWGVDYQNATPDGLDAEFITVEDALALVSGITAGGGPRLTFWPDYAGPFSPSVFTTWATLYAEYLNRTGPVEILFYTETGATCVIPAGTWAFKEGDTFYAATPVAVRLDPGTLIQNVHEFVGPMTLVGSTPAGPQLSWPVAVVSGLITVNIREGARFQSLGPAPMIVLDTLAVTDFNIEDAWLLQGASAIFHVQPSGPFATDIVFYLGHKSVLESNVISGADAAGTAFAKINVESPSASCSTVQPGWTGGSLSFGDPSGFASAHAVLERMDVGDLTVSAGGTYVITPPNQDFAAGQFVRVRPNGSLALIQIVLPAVTACPPGASYTVKRDNTDVSTQISVRGASFELLDGRFSYVVPHTAYAWLKFTSDGTHWMVQGSEVGSIPRNNFIYRQGFPRQGNLYGNWQEMMADIALLPLGSTPVVTFVRFPADPPIVIPFAGMPVTGWDMRGGTWESWYLVNNLARVNVPNGVIIDNLVGLEKSCVIVISPNAGTAALNFTAFPAPTAIVFLVGYNCAIDNSTNFGALIRVPPGPNRTVVIGLNQGNQTGLAGPLAGPLVQASNNDFIVGVQFDTTGGLPPGWVRGGLPGAFALMVSDVSGQDPTAPGYFAGFTGTFFLFLNTNDARMLPYTPLVLGNWNGINPTSVRDALDRIAAFLGPIP